MIDGISKIPITHTELITSTSLEVMLSYTTQSRPPHQKI